MPDRDQPHQPGRDWVALTLAIGVATALNIITIGVMIAAWFRGQKSGDYGLSENATQVLIAAFGGFVGILGGYVGGRAVERAQSSTAAAAVAATDAATAATDAATAATLAATGAARDVAPDNVADDDEPPHPRPLPGQP